jgi:hypothetical protein
LFKYCRRGSSKEGRTKDVRQTILMQFMYVEERGTVTGFALSSEMLLHYLFRFLLRRYQYLGYIASNDRAIEEFRSTVKPRFTNASDHEQFDLRTQSVSGDVLCLELRTRKPSTSWSDKLGVSASAVFVEE